jgi:hypothetical protein
LSLFLGDLLRLHEVAHPIDEVTEQVDLDDCVAGVRLIVGNLQLGYQAIRRAARQGSFSRPGF